MNHLTWLPVFTPILLLWSIAVGGEQVDHKLKVLQQRPKTVVEQVFDRREIQCLAKNLYFEARGESEEGMMAVGLVTINRTKTNGAYPNSICKVVYDHHQFTWTFKKQKGEYEPKQWARAVKVAHHLALGKPQDITGGSTLYHTKTVHPHWNKHKLTYVKTIGRHMFFKEKNVTVIT